MLILTTFDLDEYAYDALQAGASGFLLKDARNLSPLPPSLYRPTDRLHLRSPKEMEHLFVNQPEALENAASIAESCAGAMDTSLAATMTGCTLAEGDKLRHVMSRDRGPHAMRGLRSWFVGRAVKRGVQREKAKEVFSWIEGLGRYGFARSHVASFAEISYVSAYMMRH